MSRAVWIAGEKRVPTELDIERKKAELRLLRAEVAKWEANLVLWERTHKNEDVIYPADADKIFGYDDCRITSPREIRRLAARKLADSEATLRDWEDACTSKKTENNPMRHRCRGGRKNPLEALRLMNPAAAPAAPAAAARKYRTFHEVEPHTVTERTCWVPGELVLVGAGVEINYKVNVVDSAKDNGACYVHQFESNVKIYRRARKGEQPDEVWKNFPNELSVLGYALEFSFVDPTDGETYETKPAQHDKLATTPDGKTLVIVGSSGVKFVARGGKMKVTNWIYH